MSVDDYQKWELRIPVAKSFESDVSTEVEGLAGLLTELTSVNLKRGQTVTIVDSLDPTIRWETSRPLTEAGIRSLIDWLDATADAATDRFAPRGARERSVEFDLRVDHADAASLRFHIPEVARYASGLTLRLSAESHALGLSEQEMRQLQDRLFVFSMRNWRPGREWISLYTAKQEAVQRRADTLDRYRDLEIALRLATPAIAPPSPFALGLHSYVQNARSLEGISNLDEVVLTKEEAGLVVAVSEDATAEVYESAIRSLGYSPLADVDAELARVKSV